LPITEVGELALGVGVYRAGPGESVLATISTQHSRGDFPIEGLLERLCILGVYCAGPGESVLATASTQEFLAAWLNETVPLI